MKRRRIRLRREYRLVITRPQTGTQIHRLWDARNVLHYAYRLRRYWREISDEAVQGRIEFREVSAWQPL